jgi:hypothetical protein
MPRSYTGASARINPIIIVKCILGFAVHAEVTVGPEAGLVYLFSRPLVMDIVIFSRARATSVDCLSIFFVLVEELILFDIVPMRIVYVRCVTSLELAFLGTTTSRA